jgi:hypothetical protein
VNIKLLAILVTAIVATSVGSGAVLLSNQTGTQQIQDFQVNQKETQIILNDPVEEPIPEPLLNVTYIETVTSSSPVMPSPEGIVRYSFKLNLTKGGWIAYNIQGFDQALAPLVSKYNLLPADYDQSTLMRVCTQDKFDVCGSDSSVLSVEELNNLAIDIQLILEDFVKT